MLQPIKFHFLILSFLIPVFLQAQNFGGNPSSEKWKQINTNTSRVIFPTGCDSQAIRISKTIELLNSSTLHTIGNKWRKWNIILQNKTTVANAYVRLAPVMSEFYMIPGQDNFVNGSLRWEDNLAIHESRHMQQFSNFNNGLTKLFSFLLGQEGQLLANGITIPDYFFEGDAVWQETLVSKQGRGRMPFFYNDYRSLWQAEKKYSWMKLRSGSYQDLVPDRYSTGYLLIAYGYEKYGEDFWKKVTGDAVRFKSFFYSFNRAIERYSGKSYKQFRNDAMAYFENQVKVYIDTITEKPHYITNTKKNNVVDYQFPSYISNDSILVSKKSYRSVSSFYLLVNGSEKRLRIRNTGLDEYYHYSAGKIVYVSFQSNPRWTNRDYSVLQLVDIKSRKQQQLSFKSNYFSPCLNKNATEILLVKLAYDGSSNLIRLNLYGNVIATLPNKNNYLFTQSAYINDTLAISAVRNREGKMAIVTINLSSGVTENLTAFSYNVIGYPFVKDGAVFFNAMNGHLDKIFRLDLASKTVTLISESKTALYYPVINEEGTLLAAAFTNKGYRLISIETAHKKFPQMNDFFETSLPAYSAQGLQTDTGSLLDSLPKDQLLSTRFANSFRLFNFHSRRPFADDPEYGYNFYSDNILSSFSNIATYRYNRNERSHSVGFASFYGGWFPLLSIGAESNFNRNAYTGNGEKVTFNSAKLNAGFAIPLNYIGGRTNKFFRINAGYNIEQLYYTGIGKNIFKNESLHYINAGILFSNTNRKAIQQVNPRWAQSISANYRHAFSGNENRKLIGAGSFFFPGFFTNHSIVLQGAYQKRDTLSDLFSNTFSYSRGYEAISTRRMYKFGINYQLPVLYPEIGVGNIVYFQRIKANFFYDQTNFYARINSLLKERLNRSAGAELFFDTKVWNALPVSFGVRYSRLFDTDILNPGAKGRWEFIIPIALIPD